MCPRQRRHCCHGNVRSSEAPVHHKRRKSERPPQAELSACKAPTEQKALSLEAEHDAPMEDAPTLHDAKRRKLAAVAKHNKDAAAADAATLASAVSNILSRLSTPAGGTTGANRLAALRERVLSRVSNC